MVRNFRKKNKTNDSFFLLASGWVRKNKYFKEQIRWVSLYLGARQRNVQLNGKRDTIR